MLPYGLMVAEARIRGREVSIEIGQLPEPEGGWIAIGLVKEGLGPEKGTRFEARAADPEEAKRRLKLEIEAAFA